MSNDKFFATGTTYRLWNVCGCGCGAVVRNLFKQGHDMRTPGQKEKGR